MDSTIEGSGNAGGLGGWPRPGRIGVCKSEGGIGGGLGVMEFAETFFGARGGRLILIVSRLPFAFEPAVPCRGGNLMRTVSFFGSLVSGIEIAK
jgi:hypothetical protein